MIHQPSATEPCIIRQQARCWKWLDPEDLFGSCAKGGWVDEPITTKGYRV